MLTIKENLMETIKGGNPDRYVNQFEFMKMVRNPFFGLTDPCQKGMGPVVNQWGVTMNWPCNVPGQFPVHTPDTIVIKDIRHWRDYVKAPRVKYTDAEWEPYLKEVESLDRSEYVVMPGVFPGVFEQLHYLGEMQRMFINFYEEPDAVKDLIKFITEWEVKLAEELCAHLKPDGVFHHDDWGSQTSTFLSPEMFEEFIMPAYKEIYSCYKANDAKLIVHHSDSYAATLVPQMIEMGITIWQGVLNTNDIPFMIRKYGPQITFMGGIDSGKVDVENWSQELISRAVQEICGACGSRYFIPCCTQGGPGSIYPGVYEAVSEEINRCSRFCLNREKL